MTDTDMLNEKISESGYKKRFIAENIGISYQALLNKVNNVTEFTVSEMTALCALLNIQPDERERIFFNLKVDKTPT